MLIQEEGRLKKSKEHSVHFTVHNEASSSKAKPRYKNNKKGNASLKVNDGQIRKDICYFCKKSGHYKKDCLKRKVCTMFQYVSNQILWKYLIIPGG